LRGKAGTSGYDTVDRERLLAANRFLYRRYVQFSTPLSVFVVDGIFGSMPQAETWASISAFTFSATPRRFSTGAFEFGRYQRNAVDEQHRVGDEMPPSAGQFHLKQVDYQKVFVLRDGCSKSMKSQRHL